MERSPRARARKLTPWKRPSAAIPAADRRGGNKLRPQQAILHQAVGAFTQTCERLPLPRARSEPSTLSGANRNAERVILMLVFATHACSYIRAATLVPSPFSSA